MIPSSGWDNRPYRCGNLMLAAERQGDFQFLADAFGGELLDFPVTGNRLNLLVGRILPEGMATAFANQRAAVGLKMGKEIDPLHAGIVSSFSPRTTDFWASSRRKVRRSSMQARRSARHCSRVSPWPLASGNSAQMAAKPVSPSTEQSCTLMVRFT